MTESRKRDIQFVRNLLIVTLAATWPLHIGRLFGRRK